LGHHLKESTLAHLAAQVECYSDVVDELRGIYPQHWAELAVAADIPLEPNYEGYRLLEHNNMLLLVTLRDGAKLAGYFIGFLMAELHYTSCTSCTGDIFYVLPEYRKQWAGVKLFRAVEAELRKRNITRWHVTSKISNMRGENKDSGILLKRLGFTPVEVLYSKRLSKPTVN
jgi:GNAT superfamily N-acetyltransferase